MVKVLRHQVAELGLPNSEFGFLSPVALGSGSDAGQLGELVRPRAYDFLRLL